MLTKDQKIHREVEDTMTESDITAASLGRWVFQQHKRLDLEQLDDREQLTRMIYLDYLTSTWAI